jgi:hypothetical protein
MTTLNSSTTRTNLNSQLLKYVRAASAKKIELNKLRLSAQHHQQLSQDLFEDLNFYTMNKSAIKHMSDVCAT